MFSKFFKRPTLFKGAKKSAARDLPGADGNTQASEIRGKPLQNKPVPKRGIATPGAETVGLRDLGHPSHGNFGSLSFRGVGDSGKNVFFRMETAP